MLSNSTPLLTVLELAALIQQAHLQCKAFPTSGLLHARNAGEWLLAAKAVLPEEQWQTWLTTDCQLWESTAQTYMAIAKSWPSLEKPQITLSLEPLPVSEALEQTKPVASEDSILVDVPEESSLIPIPEGTDTVPEESSLIPIPEGIDTVPAESSLIPIPEGIDTVPAESSLVEEELENNRILTLFIPGCVVPKARPRVTANGTFLPKRYQEWRNRAEGEIILQLAQQYAHWNFPLEKVIVEVHLIGKHRTNADGDNIVGSCLDALVAAGAIKNDNLSCIPEIYFKFVSKGFQGVEIVLIPLGDVS